jgi:hypothetical protein
MNGSSPHWPFWSHMASSCTSFFRQSMSLKVVLRKGRSPICAMYCVVCPLGCAWYILCFLLPSSLSGQASLKSYPLHTLLPFLQLEHSGNARLQTVLRSAYVVSAGMRRTQVCEPFTFTRPTIVPSVGNYHPGTSATSSSRALHVWDIRGCRVLTFDGERKARVLVSPTCPKTADPAIR